MILLKNLIQENNKLKSYLDNIQKEKELTQNKYDKLNDQLKKDVEQ